MTAYVAGSSDPINTYEATVTHEGVQIRPLVYDISPASCAVSVSMNVYTEESLQSVDGSPEGSPPGLPTALFDPGDGGLIDAYVPLLESGYPARYTVTLMC